MKYLMIAMILCSSYFAGGCVAKSSHVDENSKRITEILNKMMKYHDKDKDLEFLFNKALETEEKGSAFLNEEQVIALIKKGSKLATASTGLPIDLVVGTGLSLLGLGGAGLVVDRKKRRSQLKAMGELDPEEAKKIKDVI